MDTSPPTSQSHFSKFDGFTPNDGASFDDEFSRLASSQNWTIGSQRYTQERTIAMREELKQHYFSQSQALRSSEEPAGNDVLSGYQDLCHEVGIEPSDSIADCKRALRSKLVNIVDLIDARRTGKKVKVWVDFEAFRRYTLQDKHRISTHEAKKDGGFLASLLQRLTGPGSRHGGRRHDSGRKAHSGRVMKTRTK